MSNGYTVADISTLKATTTAKQIDELIRFVKQGKDGKPCAYMYDASATAADDGDLVVLTNNAPSTGRFIKLVSAVQSGGSVLSGASSVAVTWVASTSQTVSFSSDKLTYTDSNSADSASIVLATQGKSAGKWYWEYSILTSNPFLGVGNANASGPFLGNTTDSWAYASADGSKFHANANSSYGASFGPNDVIGVALDMDAGTITFYKNSVSQGAAFTGLTGTIYPAISTNHAQGAPTVSGKVNFGATSFAYPIPTGFSAYYTPASSTSTSTNTTSGWRKIVEQQLTSAADYTVIGLNGNVDEFYQFVLTGYITEGSGTFIKLRPNNDSEANYRSTIIFGDAAYSGVQQFTTVSTNGLYVGSSDRGQSGVILLNVTLAAKSGNTRICTGTYTYAPTDSYGPQTNNVGSFWTNTTDNITSLVVNFDSFANFTGTLQVFASGGTPVTSATPTDPYASSIVLQLDMQGANGSTSITDAKGNAVTIHGNCSLSTAHSPITGGSSLYIDGSAGSYLSIPNTNFNPLHHDYTIEFYYMDAGSSTTTAQYSRVIQLLDGDLYQGWSIAFDSANTNLGISGSSSGGSADIYNNVPWGTVSSTQFDHYAAVKQGNIIKLFKNGSVTNAATVDPSKAGYWIASNLVVGGQSGNAGSNNRSIKAYIAGLRVTYAARYFTDFVVTSNSLYSTSN